MKHEKIGKLKKLKKIRIKICGITEQRELDSLIELGVDYAGFVVCFPRSKRNNTIGQAEALVRYMKEAAKKRQAEEAVGIKAVAVTVSPTAEQLQELEAAGFDILQVHGVLLPEVRKKCRLPIWRAFNLSEQESGAELEEAIADDRIAGIVLDGAAAGSGKAFPWERFEGFVSGEKTYVLAGGLASDNVGEAVRLLQPEVVDVSSGVEYDDKAKRGKDVNKIAEFVHSVRACE